MMRTFFSAFLLTVLCLLVILFATGCMYVPTRIEQYIVRSTVDGDVMFDGANDTDTAKDAAVTDPEGDVQTGEGADNITPDLSKLVPNLDLGGIGGLFDDDPAGDGNPIPPEFQ